MRDSWSCLGCLKGTGSQQYSYYLIEKPNKEQLDEHDGLQFLNWPKLISLTILCQFLILLNHSEQDRKSIFLLLL